MLTLNAFASLAQFGAGISFALTFFLEPISARERIFRSQIQQSLYLIPNDDIEENKERKSGLWEDMIALNLQVKSAKAVSKIPLLLLHLGTLLNFSLLILATVAPEAQLSRNWVQALLAISLLPPVIGSVVLALIAWIKIKSPT